MKRLLLTILLVLTIWSAANSQTLVVIGDTVTTGTSTFPFGSNFSYIRGPITVPAVGTITFDSCLVYGGNASTPTAGNPDTNTYAWYADNGSGAPGAQIYKDTVILTSTPGFRKGIKAMSLSFSSGTYANIWCAIGGTVNDSSGNVYGHSATSTGCQTGTGGGVPPSTWPACTPTSATSFMISLWGHTSGGGGPGPSPTTLNVLIRKMSLLLAPNGGAPVETKENWRWRG